jgi:hypothetical protein
MWIIKFSHCSIASDSFAQEILIQKALKIFQWKKNIFKYPSATRIHNLQKKGYIYAVLSTAIELSIEFRSGSFTKRNTETAVLFGHLCSRKFWCPPSEYYSGTLVCALATLPNVSWHAAKICSPMREKRSSPILQTEDRDARKSKIISFPCYSSKMYGRVTLEKWPSALNEGRKYVKSKCTALLPYSLTFHFHIKVNVSLT